MAKWARAIISFVQLNPFFFYSSIPISFFVLSVPLGFLGSALSDFLDKPCGDRQDVFPSHPPLQVLSFFFSRIGVSIPAVLSATSCYSTIIK